MELSQILLEHLTKMNAVSESKATKKMSEFLLIWLDSRYMHIRQNTYNGYAMILRTHMVPFFDVSEIKVGEFSAMSAESYFSFLSKKGLSRNTIRKHWVILNQVCKLAKKEHYRYDNPMDEVDAPRETPYHARYLLESEHSEVIKAVEGSLIEIPVLCALMLGLRRSEIVGLNWENIDLARGTITVSRTVVTSTDAETGKGILIEEENTKSPTGYRTLAIPKQLATKLMLQKQRWCFLHAQGWVIEDCVCFMGKGGRMRPAYITKNFRALCREKGLPEVRLHDLRHP